MNTPKQNFSDDGVDIFLTATKQFVQSTASLVYKLI